MDSGGVVAVYGSFLDVYISVFIRFDILWQNYQFQIVPYLCRKLPTEATDTREKIIQLPNSSPSLPAPFWGNGLVTELLSKSAYSCPF